MKYYAAIWKDGGTTWLQASSLKQARLLHTLAQKETPADVFLDDRWCFSK